MHFALGGPSNLSLMFGVRLPVQPLSVLCASFMMTACSIVCIHFGNMNVNYP
jgi:hypothetical protein